MGLGIGNIGAFGTLRFLLMPLVFYKYILWLFSVLYFILYIFIYVNDSSPITGERSFG